MIEIYSAGASVLLLAILLAILPLKLTNIGKMTIFLCAVIISLLLYLGHSMLQFSLIFPIAILLTALMSYIVLNRISLFHKESESGQNASHLEPLFSFDELKENAEKAETVDHYYIDSATLVKEMKNSESPLMGQDAIDKLLQQYEESGVASDEKKEIVIIERETDSALPYEELHFDVPFGREEVNQTESMNQEEYHLDLREEASIDRNPLLDDISEKDMIEIVASRESQDDLMLYDEKEIDDFDTVDEEYDLIEIRKRLFSELEEIELAATVELEEVKNQGEESDQTKEQEETHFSSEELELVFDDLEELYLRRKKKQRNEEEGE